MTDLFLNSNFAFFFIFALESALGWLVALEVVS